MTVTMIVTTRGCPSLPARLNAMAEPYPKSRQLARGQKRPKRQIATAKQRKEIMEAKAGPCRLWSSLHCAPQHELHHLVPRSLGGDDVADNLVPLCMIHHKGVTERIPVYLHVLADSLTDDEKHYITTKLGEAGLERLFGVGR